MPSPFTMKESHVAIALISRRTTMSVKHMVGGWSDVELNSVGRISWDPRLCHDQQVESVVVDDVTDQCYFALSRLDIQQTESCVVLLVLGWTPHCPRAAASRLRRQPASVDVTDDRCGRAQQWREADSQWPDSWATVTQRCQSVYMVTSRAWRMLGHDAMAVNSTAKHM